MTKFLKIGCFRRNHITIGSYKWPTGSIISFESRSTAEEKFLRLRYTTTSQGESRNHNYKIQLATVPSNLGKGEVLYFVCPESNRLCRALYFSPRTQTFVSRQAFPARMYYPLQFSAKRGRANDQYWHIESTLKELANQRKETFLYKGEKTQYCRRIEQLLEKQAEADRLRWSYESYPYALRKEMVRLLKPR
ncbi:MAG: hypothetical protein IPM81_14320 [Saprospirales bacterium]|nr:hypothetical protein [Saprospirales bacterium]